MKPFVQVTSRQWGNFQYRTKTLELDEEETLMLKPGGLLGSIRDAQFYRDLVGRVVGDEFNQSEIGHEHVANLSRDEKKELMLKLMKATSKLYDMEVASILAAGSTSSLPAPSGNEQKTKKRGRKKAAEEKPTESAMFPPSPLQGWFDTELFAVLGSTLGFDHMPSSESWCFAGYLFQYYTISNWYLQDLQETDASSSDSSNESSGSDGAGNDTSKSKTVNAKVGTERSTIMLQVAEVKKESFIDSFSRCVSILFPNCLHSRTKAK